MSFRVMCHLFVVSVCHVMAEKQYRPLRALQVSCVHALAGILFFVRQHDYRSQKMAL